VVATGIVNTRSRRPYLTSTIDGDDSDLFIAAAITPTITTAPPTAVNDTASRARTDDRCHVLANDTIRTLATRRRCLPRYATITPPEA